MPWTAPTPIDREAERVRLKRIAAEIAKRKDMQCELRAPSGRLLDLLIPNEKERLNGELKSIVRERVVENFPIDEGGRLSLATTVLLGAFRSSEPPARDRDVCLAAIGPERRRDPQVLKIEIVDLIVPNQSHQWDRCRWLWTADAPPPECMWGTTPGDTEEERRAFESLRLLDQGKIEESLSLYGVSLSPDLHRLLGGEEISSPACCSHPDQSWTGMLVRTLREAAPWLLPRAVSDEAERIGVWRSQKKGRPRRPPELKMVIFPGQFHARKASLMLVGDIDGKNPTFVIEATASNARLHDTAWRRPLAVDMRRYGIESIVGDNSIA